MQKSVPVPTQEEFQNIFSSPSKINKTPVTQADISKSLQRITDTGIQGRPRRTPDGNTGLAKVVVQCSADTFVVNECLVLRINICSENRHFRQARNRYASLNNTNLYNQINTLSIYLWK
ncbi:MAG: hypothetical protein KA767_01590 [Saprospiraceae bacterium]|nr:hypothetical protein [Saprospiraceae bacterium]